MSWLFRSVLGFLLLKLGILAVNLVRFPVLQPRRAAVEPPAGELSELPGADVPGAELPGAERRRRATVSVLVPMRDEEPALRDTLPAILAQRGADQIVVLDDGSSDGSLLLARSLAESTPTARVVPGKPLPAGWVGKNWACQQLADVASGDVLAFCDADVLLAEGALEAALDLMVAQHADVFSVFPRQRIGSRGEALVVPFIDDLLLCFLPFPLLSLNIPAAATANGSLLLFTRAAYQALGGHAAVRRELVEDVVIARRARRAGLKLGLALGGDAVTTRMYRGYPEVVRGLGRGLLVLSGGSRALLAAAAGWHLLVYTVPPVLGLGRHRWWIVLALGVTERAAVALKCSPGTAWQAPLVPLFPVALVPVVAQALRRSQTWKGRSYR